MATRAHTNQTPTTGDAFDGSPITVAATGQFGVAGSVTELHFWVPGTNTGTYTLKLYEITAGDDQIGGGTGLELASVQVVAGDVTPNDWAVVPITPVAIDTAKHYRAARHASSGRYVATGAAFNAGTIANGDVTLIQTGTSTGLGSLRNGTFQFGSATPVYPFDSFNGTDYFVDFGFVPATTVTSAGRLQVGARGTAAPQRRQASTGRLQAGGRGYGEGVSVVVEPAAICRRASTVAYQRSAPVEYVRADTLIYRRD